jgi:hypothetical protein
MVPTSAILCSIEYLLVLLGIDEEIAFLTQRYIYGFIPALLF